MLWTTVHIVYYVHGRKKPRIMGWVCNLDPRAPKKLFHVVRYQSVRSRTGLKFVQPPRSGCSPTTGVILSRVQFLQKH